MNNKTYDLLKWIAQFLLPASGTLYFALASIWGLPYGEQVVGTITALTAFLGIVLGISTSQYHKQGRDGILHIDKTNPEVDKYNIELIKGFDEIDKMKQVSLKVDNPIIDEITTEIQRESRDKHSL